MRGRGYAGKGRGYQDEGKGRWVDQEGRKGSYESDPRFDVQPVGYMSPGLMTGIPQGMPMVYHHPAPGVQALPMMSYPAGSITYGSNAQERLTTIMF